MNNSKIILKLIAIVLLTVSLQACGGGEESSNKNGSGQTTAQNESGLSGFELEHGVGPITEVVELGELDQELAAQGQEVFETKCTACHKTNERYIGPPLNDVLDKRTPTYVMNMILNPDGMVKKHPEAKKLLQEYLSPMTNQNLSREQVRALVEYFRTLE